MRIYTRKHTSCIVPGCTSTKGCGAGGRYFSKGYCHKHYELFRRNGVPERKPRIKRPIRPCVMDGCIGETRRKDGLCGLHLHRKEKFGSPSAETTRPKQSKGYDAESIVGQMLRSGGRSAIRIFGKQGDLLVDHYLKVEVKTADMLTLPGGDIRWSFNIHRHGVLDEKADYYVFRFLNIPGAKHPLHAAFRGPLGVLTVHFSMIKMLYEIGPALHLFEDLKWGKLSRSEATHRPVLTEEAIYVQQL